MNLKFRVFDTKNNKYIEDLSNFWISPLFNNVFMEWRSEWDGETVFEFNDKDFIFQQWTGLVDVNGKEIYDGDIILAPLYGIEGKDFDKMVVKFWRAKFTLDSSSGCYGGVAIGNINSIYLSVIGNIFENPELL